MKRILFYSALCIVLIASAGFAQMKMGDDGQMGMMGQGGMGCGMMGGGMMGQGMMGGMGQMGGMMGQGMMGMMMDDDHPAWKMLGDLDLTDKQKDEILDIKTKIMKDSIRKKADKQIAKVELMELLDKETVDLKAVETTLKKIEALETDMTLSHIKAREEIKAKLTPEQRKTLGEGMKMRHLGPRKGMGRGMMPMMMQQPQAPSGGNPVDGKDPHGH